MPLDLEMDQNEDQKILINNKKQHFVKRTMQFVFSISAFSILVWYSSGFSIHPQSFNAYFSTCLFSLFTHTLERKYMFLICNGILAFLVKNSLIMSSSSPDSDDHFELHSSNLSETKVVPSNISDNMNVVVVPHVDEEQEEYCEEVSEAEEQKEEDTCLYNQNEAACMEEEEEEEEGEVIKLEEYQTDEEGEITESDEVKVAEDEDDDDIAEITTATTINEVNTEELNRKFEEFIRKMKEEMRIEAQRQLIAV